MARRVSLGGRNEKWGHKVAEVKIGRQRRFYAYKMPPGSGKWLKISRYCLNKYCVRAPTSYRSSSKTFSISTVHHETGVLILLRRVVPLLHTITHIALTGKRLKKCMHGNMGIGVGESVMPP